MQRESAPFQELLMIKQKTAKMDTGVGSLEMRNKAMMEYLILTGSVA
jgi:hypothetical protein